MDDDVLKRFRSFRNDPWEFLSKCVFTLDSTDKDTPIKRFPADQEYLKCYVRAWQEEKKIAVPKSRRMFFTWVNVALYLWDTMFHKGRQNAIVSKKEDDSDDLIRRAKFIFDHIPEDQIPKELLPKAEYKHCHLTFPEMNSQLRGFPQGEDQLRQFTFSGILADEIAFWEKAQESYSASVPTLEGGGRFTAISSPAPGFFKKLVFDTLDTVEESITGNSAQRHYPCQGVEIWHNEKNKFLIFQVHFTANPKKRDPSYMEAIRSAMPMRQFNQEYNLQWETFQGNPVYPDWSEKAHGVSTEIKPEVGLPLILGLDFGLTPAAVIAQLQGDVLMILKEFTAINMGAERFMNMISKKLALDYPNWRDFKNSWLTFVDPSGFFRKDTNEGTCSEIVHSFGFSPIPGDISLEERRTAVEYFLVRSHKGIPCLKVSVPNCPQLVRGFNGGYMYSDRAFEIEPSKVTPVKNEFSHPHDALQYICGGIRNHKKKKRSGSIPQLSYSFLRSKTE